LSPNANREAGQLNTYLLIKNVVSGCNIGIMVFKASNNTIAENDIRKNVARGIYLNLSQRNNLWMNDIYNCPEGILLEHCKDNNLSHNHLQDNDYGIMLHASNHNNFSENNIIRSNTGINLDQSSHNIIQSNELSENNEGIIIVSSIENTLEKNIATSRDASITLISSTRCNITGNSVHGSRLGIKLVNCSFNQLYLNDIRQNNDGLYLDEGVYPQQSSGNKVYLNSFINNLRDVNSYISTNSWNSPQALSYRFQGKIFKNHLGNYWQGTRVLDDNNDGISDLYHNIGSDIDENPLMEPAAIYEII